MMGARLLKAYLPAVLWMSIIFIGSTDLGSSKRTSRIIGPILRWINPNVSDDTIYAIQAVVRKGGHVTVYAVLAALTWRGRRVARGVKLSERGWSWPEMWGIVGFCAAYAVTDELHQHFVSSRQASPFDVGLDTFGAMLMLLVIWTIGRWRKLW
jgi:VanZ family protein